MSAPQTDECPWCDRIIERGRKGLMPLTIHLTNAHTRTELAMIIVDWMCNGVPKRDRIKK